MLPAGMEPTTPVSEQPQTHTLDRAAAGIGPPYRYGPVNSPTPFMCDTPPTFVQF